MRWDQQRVMVTGGASFIGCALVDALFSTKKRPEVAAILDQVLTERKAKPVTPQIATAD